MSTQLPTRDASFFEPPPEAVDFYVESLKLLNESQIPYLLSGTYALGCFTGISRPTKDLDVFCKPSDAPKILGFFKDRGYGIEMEDERWIGKVWRGEHFFDVIFNISSASIFTARTTAISRAWRPVWMLTMWWSPGRRSVSRGP